MSLSAQTPQNFDASFSEQYGNQELNAVPIEAGQTKDLGDMHVQAAPKKAEGGGDE